jgi:glutathione S-transferase
MLLYHHPMSGNSRRATMTAVHLNSPVELVLVDLSKGHHKKPDYLRLNPNGRVPVLDDDGFVLWESSAIIQYLADKTPGQTVYPIDVRGRADVNRWLFWSAAHFMPAVGILNFEHFVKRIIGAGEPDPAAVQRGEELVKENARILDRHLEKKTWVLGDRLTLADFSIAAALTSMGSAKLPVRDFVHLMAWFGRVQELDAWKRTSV